MACTLTYGDFSVWIPPAPLKALPPLPPPVPDSETRSSVQYRGGAGPSRVPRSMPFAQNNRLTHSSSLLNTLPATSPRFDWSPSADIPSASLNENARPGPSSVPEAPSTRTRRNDVARETSRLRRRIDGRGGGYRKHSTLAIDEDCGAASSSDHVSSDVEAWQRMPTAAHSRSLDLVLRRIAYRKQAHEQAATNYASYKVLQRTQRTALKEKWKMRSGDATGDT